MHMKESEVKLTVSIIVEYGIDIPRVADEVQENVKRAVEKMTGLVLAEVDVVVEGVRQQSHNDKERKI
ncbi:MAG: Asp23/Gls24 family envelope stress response protein [Candidatus Omnitrophota bacterium]